MAFDVVQQRTGQISIDYIAGAIVFFGAILVLISSVLNVIPQFQQTNAVNELELAGWGLSEVLMNDAGYWANGTGDGMNWHDADRTDVEVLGLQSADRNGLSIQKIKALRDTNYSTLQDALEFDRDFAVSFTQIQYIDTYHRFNRSSPTGPVPSRIVQPSYPSNTEDTVHYGTQKVNGAPYYFLLADNVGWYNHLWVSDDWDFTDDDTRYYNLSQDNIVTLRSESHVLNIADIQIGDGNTIILQRRIGRAGTVPPDNTANIIEIKRFGAAANTENSIIRAVFQVW